MTIRPWLTLDDCRAVIAAAHPDSPLAGCHPTFCLSGDADCPADHDALFLDMDYKPGADADGLGAIARDLLTEGLARAGAAVFASMSGTGRHVVARLTPEDISAGRRHYRGLPTPRNAAGPQPKPRQSGFHGLRVEIFPAGTRRHVVWHPHRRLAGPDPEAPLGMVGLRDAAPAVGVPCARPVQDARFQLLLKLLAISSGAPVPVRKARVPRVVNSLQQGLTRCQKGRSDRQSCVWG